MKGKEEGRSRRVRTKRHFESDISENESRMSERPAKKSRTTKRGPPAKKKQKVGGKKSKRGQTPVDIDSLLGEVENIRSVLSKEMHKVGAADTMIKLGSPQEVIRAAMHHIRKINEDDTDSGDEEEMGGTDAKKRVFIKRALLTDKVEIYVMAKNCITIGRSFTPDVDIVVDEKCISKRHFRIFYDSFWNGRFILVNYSKNGVIVNGEKVLRDPLVIRDGYSIRVGSKRFKFSVLKEPEKVVIEV